MSSRLDRLFILLESGSTPYTRQAAATQLGELQRLHPHELHSLLRQIYRLLSSNCWDTRVAASQAIAAVVKHTPPWQPVPVENCSDGTKRSTPTLTLDMLDIGQILSTSSCLTASQGNEFDVEESDTKDSLQRARQQLNAKLGIPLLDTDAMVSGEDVFSSCKESEDSKLNVSEVLGSSVMSSREANRARRKARLAKTRSASSGGHDTAESGVTGPPGEKKLKLEEGEDESGGEMESVPDDDGTWGDAIDWPLEAFCDRLCSDLFSPLWEVRHGVATALREVIKIHGRGACKSVGQTRTQMEESNHAWLEDISVRLLCVLALDRFGDFVSDQVVAPVRETCAQVLGVVMSLLKEESLVTRVVDVLLSLTEQQNWETRHGGLLGLKYILAVKPGMVKTLLPRCLRHILSGLRDCVDDVANIAAATLIPVASHLMTSQTNTELSSYLPELTSQLWTLLAEQDQLTSACNNFMSLLAAILCHPNSRACTALSERVMSVLPRLFPYLSHSTSSVRLATLQTMATLTRAQSSLDCSVDELVATLRHVFQRALIEHVLDIEHMLEQVWESIVTRVPLNTLLMAVCPHIASWLCLVMQPVTVPFDSSQLLLIESHGLDSAELNAIKFYIGGVETVPLATREGNATRCRLLAARLLGLLSTYVIQPMPGVAAGSEGAPCPVQCYVNLLLVYVNSKSAMQRFVAGLVIANWNRRSLLSPPSPSLNTALIKCLDENIYYDELGTVYTKLLQDTTDLLAFMKHYELSFNYEAFNRVLNLDEIELLVGTQLVTALEEQRRSRAIKCYERVDERRRTILSTAQTTRKEQFTWQIMVQAVLAGALLRLECLPVKINPVIKPLMESVKFQTQPLLQELAATHLALLIAQCCDRNPSPNNKIVQNLCTFLCCDPDNTPVIEGANHGSSHPLLVRSNSELSEPSTPPCTPDTPSSNSSVFWSAGDHAYPRGKSLEDTNNEANSNKHSGILTLIRQQEKLESKVKSAKSSTKGLGRSLSGAATSSYDLAVLNTCSLDVESETQKQCKNQCRGASFALKAIVTHFADSLPNKLPKLWEMVVTLLTAAVKPDDYDPLKLRDDDEAAKSLVSCLQVFEVIAPALHSKLLSDFLSLQARLNLLLSHPYRAVRHMASRCLASLAPLDINTVLGSIITDVVPYLASPCDLTRQGAVECLLCVLDKLGLKAVPYLVLLVVPLLGRVSDQDCWVRLGATSSFATCIHLLPLDTPLSSPSSLSLPAELAAKRAEEAQFLAQLFEPARIPDFVLPAELELTVSLRGYQQAGVNWLWFLRTYNLHGILCDDMGLGKTLQSICVLAGDLYERRKSGNPGLPNLVVCVPTLTGHWFYEILKFLPNKFLNPLEYAGPPHERERLRTKIHEHNLIIASYDIVRKDLAVFTEVQWNYCILDEGHVIKNDKAKSTRAIKQLRAKHRLILSGTPIQNNVLELWSLFDFLMPGYLGTEKKFNSRYARPILMSRDAKSSTKDQEAGVLAMEALHRQVLPLVLRRIKQDVLKDLPPKITQDYYCQLSPLQERLYGEFAKMNNLDLNDEKQNHVFQSLRYLQSVCNHPKLILTPSHAQYDTLVTRPGLNLADIEHAAKLPALKQLLLDCGIGGDLPQHRALIFCQLKAMLDIVETDLFKAEMPSVTYLRLDGTVPTTSRHGIVHKFNSDPTIDVLLLTTQVGGLGLNLTGADTVIFVEHDWSPMKDLQAMDRAHRIGQKKVVNVYRLITKNTLEEKIMNLQKFKLFTANTVINGENRNLTTMATGNLLDLFSLESNGESSRSADTRENSGLKSLLDTLPELWDEREYEEEYDLTSFVQALR